MLTKEQLHEKIASGIRILDGATGSNLRKAGMPNGVCTEEWVLHHPEVLVKLQRDYARAGSQILYAPTFQAQPIALERVGLADETEKINKNTFTDMFLTGELLARKFYEKIGFSQLDKKDPAQRYYINYLNTARKDEMEYLIPFNKPLQKDEPRWFSIFG